MAVLSWQTPTFNDSYYGTLQYAKDGNTAPYVVFRGSVTGQINGSVLFTLPSGYLPNQALSIAAATNLRYSTVFWNVDTSGNVTLTATANAVLEKGPITVYCDGLGFPQEN